MVVLLMLKQQSMVKHQNIRPTQIKFGLSVKCSFWVAYLESIYLWFSYVDVVMIINDHIQRFYAVRERIFYIFTAFKREIFKIGRKNWKKKLNTEKYNCTLN